MDDPTITAPAVPVSGFKTGRTESEILDELHRSRDVFGTLNTGTLRLAAGELGISERQVRRRLNSYLSAVPAFEPYVVDDSAMTVIMAHNGNIKSAYTDLKEAGVRVPSYTTFWRGFTQRIETDIIGYVREGADGMRRNTLYITWEPDCRNEVSEIDHCELAIDVIADGCATTTTKPWITAIIDAKTRRVKAWSLTADVERRPDADIVCAIVAEASMEITLDGVQHGGIAGTIRTDQGADFLGLKFSQFAERGGFDVHPVFANSGHLKGKIERWFLTLETEFCTHQNGFTHGPVTYTGRQPFRKTELMTADELRRRLRVWIAEYNATRPHSALGGSTPNADWAADHHPLRFLPDALVREQMLLSDKTPKVTKKGLFFAGRVWTDPVLHGHVGRHVSVRFPIYHTGFIDVYDGNNWLCSAHVGLTQHQKKQLLAKRRRNSERASGILNDATMRRNVANGDAANDPNATIPRSAAVTPDPLAGDLDALDDLNDRLSTWTPFNGNDSDTDAGFDDEEES